VNVRRQLLLGLLLATLVPLGGWGQEPSSPQLGPDFARAPLTERRRRARELLQRPGAGSLEEVAGALADPDAQVRSILLRYLGDLEFSGAADHDARLRILATLARDDPAAEVRLDALKALGALRTEAAAHSLWSLVETLPPGERVEAARRLAELREGRGQIAGAVRRSFSDSLGGNEVPAEVLAELLVAYGRGLAETEGGGDVAADRAPLVLGQTHPDPAVRRATERALEAFLRGLRRLDQHSRADRILGLLVEDGLPLYGALFHRTVAILEGGGVDPLVALEGARELERSAVGRDGWVDLRWRSRAALLEGLALLALDRTEEADAALVRAGDLLDGLIARRIDRRGGVAGAGEQGDLLLDRGLAEFSRAFRRLAAGGAADDLALLEILRRAHRFLLEAQLVTTIGDAPTIDSFEPLLDSPLSPFRLVFAIVPHPAWPPERCLALGLRLGRSLASVSARELPGFEPFPDLPVELADPVQDPRRSGLLVSITLEELEALQRRYGELRARDLLSAGDDPETEAEMKMVSYAIWRLGEDIREKSLEQRYLDLRLPAPLALQLAELCSREGDTEPCRALATGFLEELERRELPQRYTWAVRYAASARLTIGGAWGDENEGDRAEEEMLTGLELLEGLRATYTERNAHDLAADLDGAISDALVSLAVNANVKRKDQVKALEFFERAYELDQGDFMRILLACYRARSGQADEARELIRGIPVSPRGYYNLACTYALLGEKQRALELLERDLKEVRTSAGALKKQKEWAREDPDLESLWDDPRFQWLTETEQETD